MVVWLWSFSPRIIIFLFISYNINLGFVIMFPSELVESRASSCVMCGVVQGKREKYITKKGELQHAFRTLRLWQLTLDTIVLLSHTKQMGFLSYGHIMRNGSLFMKCLPVHVTLGSFPHFLYPSFNWGATPHFDSLLLCWLGLQKSSNDLENHPISRARCPRHCGEVTLCLPAID